MHYVMGRQQDSDWVRDHQDDHHGRSERFGVSPEFSRANQARGTLVDERLEIRGSKHVEDETERHQENQVRHTGCTGRFKENQLRRS